MLRILAKKSSSSDPVKGNFNVIVSDSCPSKISHGLLDCLSFFFSERGKIYHAS